MAISLYVWPVVAGLGGVLFTVLLAIYRLYFSPLAKFPGSKLAAATGWYEFYYDWWLNGKYIYQVEKMHEKYGPIIRLNPEEISISDPDFYNELYVPDAKRRTNNHNEFCKGIDFDGAHNLTTDHDLHRRRRKPLEPFFSRLGINRLQPMMADVVHKLEQRIRGMQGQNKVIRLDHAFSAFSGDIIGRICWTNNQEFLDDENFTPEWSEQMHMIIRSIPLFTGFPTLVQIFSSIPESVLFWIYPDGRSFLRLKTMALEHIQAVRREHKEKGSGHDANPNSIFRHIFQSDMPESELSDSRLVKEAQVLLSGGTVSTARTLGFASYYILSRPEIRKRLQTELVDVMSKWPEQVPTWVELEKLEYLQAVIKESLRLSYGIMHRLPRVSPDVPIQYKEWAIPPGTPVGMSAYLMHNDASVFPEPKEFVPERWVGDVSKEMQRSYVPWCRGSRNCLGQNLAMAEMSLALAVLYRPGGPEFQLYETDESDILQAHDFIIPLPRLDSPGLRVLVP